MKQLKFRHELKYLINHKDLALLRPRLRAVMRPDPHAVGGQYKIRSLYFDDYWNSAYGEKMAGVYQREKYRIRIYNDDDSVIRLECKNKRGSYICKESAPLTRAETERIIEGDYGFLLRRGENLCRKFYYCCTSRVMRPCVIVDYEREPYVCAAGDVRVTFDRNVRSTTVFRDIFDPVLPSPQYVLEDGKLVMEVKFTEFLPEIIRKLLQLESAESAAVSKYTFCYEKSSGFFTVNEKNY